MKTFKSIHSYRWWIVTARQHGSWWIVHGREEKGIMLFYRRKRVLTHFGHRSTKVGLSSSWSATTLKRGSSPRIQHACRVGFDCETLNNVDYVKILEMPVHTKLPFHSIMHGPSAIHFAASSNFKARFSDFSYLPINESHNSFPDQDAPSSSSSKHRRNHMDSLNPEARTQERA